MIKELCGENELKKLTFGNFIRVFDSNLFGLNFIRTGGCKLPDQVTYLLGKIHAEAECDTTMDMGKYFYKYFTNRFSFLFRINFTI